MMPFETNAARIPLPSDDPLFPKDFESQPEPYAPSPNPYEVPDPVFQGPYGPPPAGYAPANNDGTMVWQVKLLSIFQFIVGSMEILMSFCFFSLVLIMFTAALDEFRGEPAAMWVAAVIYGGLGLIVFLSGVLRLMSGRYMLSYRGRPLALVSVVYGMITGLTCYCAPFSIGVGIYGLIVLLHPAVATAFEMRKQGQEASAIRAHFGLR